jgi:hypothetical protein
MLHRLALDCAKTIIAESPDRFANELTAHGFLNERGKPYAAKSIASMLGR